MSTNKILPKGVKKQLQRLNTLTTGPGALTLPKSLTRVDLMFQKSVKEQGIGAKQFWRQYLPPIQFYNPDVVISVRRFEDASQRPLLTLEYAEGNKKEIPIATKSAEEVLEILVKEGAEKVAKPVELGVAEY
ncbi:54S ribosomal protein MRP49, mitochondrial [Wickerhamiella sorbophila]|uniref:54S ribosomal protein MRP49, mitochondrial n=1 Tax=Wickerhamiella sorbophila TaxID=45607 RepID=A0A2T0FMD5_9ASCO|nr:54S ribosomal protein MRP49, mitochondrial [Wickerhamiella sorbophila]PRT56139.1 54S ribosomal protein MRP49, mitochondrial [Wickerhamiella sorbophila]